MALTQHQTQEMILEALYTLTKELDENPPTFPEEAAATVVWRGELTDAHSDKVGHAVVYVLMTDDGDKASAITDALSSAPFQV